MNTTMLIAAVAVGAFLGAFYFGALWFTVRRLATTANPALLLVASLLVRMTVVLLSFFIVAGGHWERWVACVVGFMVVRGLLVRRIASDGHLSDPMTASSIARRTSG